MKLGQDASEAGRKPESVNSQVNLTPENRPIVPIVIVNINADEVRSAKNDIVVKTKKLGKRKSNGSSEAGPVEDPIRGPPSAPGTPVALMGSPEAQRLIDKNAKQIEVSQKQIIDRQNMLMRMLADRQREQDAILDDSDSSPVARVARRLDLSDRSMQPPDRVTRRRHAHTRSTAS